LFLHNSAFIRKGKNTFFLLCKGINCKPETVNKFYIFATLNN